MEVANLNEQLEKEVRGHNEVKKQVEILKEKVEDLSSEVNKNQNRKI